MPKPKIFINKINKELKNNKNSYYFKAEEVKEINNEDRIDVREEINALFNSDNFVYKAIVEITLKNNNKKIIEIIALKDNNLITIDGEKIDINDIINIKKAN